MRGTDVALDHGSGETFNDGTQTTGRCGCSGKKRTIDQSASPFHAEPLRFVIRADD